MRDNDLFEEIGKLSDETAQVCETMKPHRRTFMPYAAAVLSFIILTAGILSVIRFVQPRRSEDQPKIQLSHMPAEEDPGNVSDNDYCVGGVTVTTAPVPVFGLSPLNSQFVKLLSEEVVFNRDSTRIIKTDEHYNVEMRYTVEIAEKTEFENHDFISGYCPS